MKECSRNFYIVQKNENKPRKLLLIFEFSNKILLPKTTETIFESDVIWTLSVNMQPGILRDEACINQYEPMKTWENENPLTFDVFPGSIPMHMQNTMNVRILGFTSSMRKLSCAAYTDFYKQETGEIASE